MLELENYKKEKLTINLSWANIFGILILIPIGLVFGVPFFMIWKPQIDVGEFLSNMGPEGSELGMVAVLFTLILGIVVHELIHGITWAIFAKKGFKSIKFGVLWKVLTPYCHCKEPLYVRQYIIGAITPALFLGILPSLVAIMIGDFGLLLFGMFFTMAAGGDFLVINLIRKENSSDLVQDHPSEAGCYIYRKVD
ncbi:DUF3267 domain-containing protein [Flammeovirga sp. OC4]|uniref:DUF3267 domain-containing protein n=1 Tax=Flammeovirga sp. OC4 TaxID=1382345 RepID=UPI0005C4CAEF|nr:DUF3267 domain-containing protein [Flammeovirga sp. OC4]